MAYFGDTESGDRLEEQCRHCRFDWKSCPAHKIHMRFNQDQLHNDELKAAMDILIEPETFTCSIFLLLDHAELV